MIHIEAIWLALGASDLRGGIDVLLGLVVRGFAGGVQPHHAYVFANRRCDRLKVLVYDGLGLWLATRRLQAGSFAWPRDAAATMEAQSRAIRLACCRATVATVWRLEPSSHHGDLMG